MSSNWLQRNADISAAMVIVAFILFGSYVDEVLNRVKVHLPTGGWVEQPVEPRVWQIRTDRILHSKSE